MTVPAYWPEAKCLEVRHAAAACGLTVLDVCDAQNTSTRFAEYPNHERVRSHGLGALGGLWP